MCVRTGAVRLSGVLSGHQGMSQSSRVLANVCRSDECCMLTRAWYLSTPLGRAWRGLLVSAPPPPPPRWSSVTYTLLAPCRLTMSRVIWWGEEDRVSGDPSQALVDWREMSALPLTYQEGWVTDHWGVLSLQQGEVCWRGSGSKHLGPVPTNCHYRGDTNC